MSRSFRKVHLRSMNDVLKNIAMRKYIISYCRECDGFVFINYKIYGYDEEADLTSALSMKNANIPEDVVVELDVTGDDSETIIDFIIKNIDGMTPVEE